MVMKTEVVISGVGGYFPKANNIEEFKERLLNNDNFLGSRSIKDIFQVSNVIAPIPINRFDASCFALYPEHCYVMDPQFRLAYERAYEAVMDAGVNPMEIKGEKVGVFGGMCITDNIKLMGLNTKGHTMLGTACALLPNRISYVMNLKGPSEAIMCNWMGGIQALELAYEAVRNNKCKAAIAVTTNLVLNAQMSWLFNDLGLLSSDGLTRPFSENASGYGRSDGVIAFYIQRASDARRCYASLLGVKGIYDGNHDAGIRDMNSEKMAEFMQSFYNECQMNPADVEFVECYGCGIKEYDEAELDAIDKVYCKNRKRPLLVGSVKSNVGHAESASVFMSIAKTLIAMESGIIPATLYYDSPNSNCKPLIDGKIVVVDKNKRCDLNLVAINAMGMTSAYGHVLLQARSKQKNMQQIDNIPRLINICTRTPEGMEEIINLLKTENQLNPEYISLIHETFKISTPMHVNRGYLLPGNEKEIKSQTKSCTGERCPLWFVYSGMGSQWIKMGADLMGLPIFAETVRKCHKVLEPKGVDLLHILTGNDDTIFRNILNCFVGIAAVQIGLTEILNAVGIVPDGMIGHSVGELGCAYADKCLTAEQMILCAYYRGKASLEADLIPGMMAAIGIGYENLKPRCPPNIDIACHNSSESCTISGPTKDVEEFVELLMDEKVFAKLVNVANIAYHSRYIKPVAPLLLKYLKEIIPKPRIRSSKWISTSIRKEEWNTDLAKSSSAEYLANNLLSEVLFEECTKYIPKNAIVLEIAPHGLLQAILKRSLIKCTHIPLTSRFSKNGLRFLLEALGKLYLSGVDMDLSKMYPKVDYPVDRGTKSLAPLVKWDHAEDWSTSSVKRMMFLLRTNVQDLEIGLNDSKYQHLTGHSLHDAVIVPTSFYLEILYEIMCLLSNEDKKINAVVEDIHFEDVLIIPRGGKRNVYAVVTKGSGNFEIMSDTRLLGTGRIKILKPDSPKDIALPTVDQTDYKFNLNDTEVYNEFQHRKHNYSGSYRLIKNLTIFSDGSTSTVKYNNHWPSLIESMLQQVLFHKGEHEQNSLIVTRIQRIVLETSSLPAEAGDVEVVYNSPTGGVSTNGITISGVKAEPSEKYKIKKMTNETDFVSLIELKNVHNLDIENVIDLSLKHCIESFGKVSNYNPKIIEIQTENSLLENRMLNGHSKLKTVFHIEKDIRSLIFFPGQPLLVVFNNNLNQDCIDFVISSNAFLLARTDSNKLNVCGIAEITRFQVGDILYSLIRKIPESVPRIVPVYNNVTTNDEISLLNMLNTDLLLNQDNRIYLIFKSIPLQGIINQVNAIRLLPNAENLRFVYILDENSPEFSVQNPFYAKIFDCDLILSIVTAGSVHTYMAVPKEIKKTAAQSFKTCSNDLNHEDIRFVGVNVSEMEQKYSENLMLECLDYSGVRSSNKKVMGMGRVDLKWGKLVPDPILAWDVPEHWTLENAATVPCVYVMAYYTLVIKGEINRHKTVLIQDACTPFGIAAIRVARKFVNSIFVTVYSDLQKVYLKKTFSFMTDHYIFDANNISFEDRILEATGGYGADIVLSSSSTRMLDTTMRCIATGGRLIYTRKLELTERNSIGMYTFKSNVRLDMISIKDIFDLHSDVKRKLHGLILDGITKLTILPLPHEIIESNIRKVLRNKNHRQCSRKILIQITDKININNINETKAAKYLLNSDSSFLIYGGTPEMWLDLVEWLIFRGAKTIAITSRKPSDSHIAHRIHVYQTYYNVNIQFLPLKDNSKNGSLTTIVNQMAPLKAVFILSENNPEAALYLNQILKAAAPDAFLVNFVPNLAGICEMRNYVGSVGYNVHYDTSKNKFVDILDDLDGMFKCDTREIVTKTKTPDAENEASIQSLHEKLSVLLPRSIKELKEEMEETTKEPDFVQLPSLATHTKEVPPTFIIPGLYRTRLIQALSNNLMSVCYCASYPTTLMPLKDLAAALVKKIRKIRNKGPYNIVGISYGGVLAVEVTRLLDEDNCKTLLHLLDGAPDTIQSLLKLLGNGTSSEIGILYHTLKIANNQILKEISNLRGWNRRVDLALTYSGCSIDDKSALRNALTTLKNHLAEILDYQTPETLITGKVCLLRPKDADKDNICGLLKYCSKEIHVYLIPANHLTMPQKKETANIINENMLCW